MAVTSLDYDGDGVTYTLTDSAGIFTIDAFTGVISIANADNMVGDEEYLVTVIASDGIGSTLASMTAKPKGEWFIISPSDGATLAQANSLKVKVRHPKDYAWGFKVELMKDGAIVQTKEKGADRGFEEEFDFGTLEPGDYKLVYSKLFQGEPEMKGTHNIRIQ